MGSKDKYEIQSRRKKSCQILQGYAQHSPLNTCRGGRSQIWEWRKMKKSPDWWKSFESICPLPETSLPQHISFSWTRHNSHSLRWRIRKLEFKPNESFSCLTPFPLYVVCSLVSTLHAHYVNIWTWTLGRKIWFSTRDFWSFPSWKLWCSKHIHIKCLCAAEIINQRDL